MLTTLVMEISAYHASFFPKPQIPLEPVKIYKRQVGSGKQYKKGISQKDAFFCVIGITTA
jgi:hypothetical protein